jgi:cysteine desulfurase
VYGQLRCTHDNLQRDHARVKELSDRLIKGITDKVEHVVRNGDPNGYPGCVNLSFSYVEGESLLMALKVRTCRISILSCALLMAACRILPFHRVVLVHQLHLSHRMFSVPLVSSFGLSYRITRSHVHFIGAAEDMAHSSLRFGIGRFTTEAEVDFVIKHIIKTVDRLREMR